MHLSNVEKGENEATDENNKLKKLFPPIHSGLIKNRKYSAEHTSDYEDQNLHHQIRQGKD